VPEGHTIHRLARDHASWFTGERVRVDSPQGRFTAGAGLLDGARFEGTDAHGKHLFHRYEADRVVHVHLGLFGRFFRHETPPPAPRETVRYRVMGGGTVIDLVGATTCELLTPDEVEGVVARLGPDPIRDDADPERAFTALRRRTVGIGQALLDQRVVSGIGNVFRAEVLYVHGVHPELPARELPRERWEPMWDTLVTWLRRGVGSRRIVTMDPHELGKPRNRMRREEATYVYKRDRCFRCATAIRRWDLGGRWAYACESCQPPPRGRR
jgi:endonuclease VIII